MKFLSFLAALTIPIWAQIVDLETNSTKFFTSDPDEVEAMNKFCSGMGSGSYCYRSIHDFENCTVSTIIYCPDVYLEQCATGNVCDQLVSDVGFQKGFCRPQTRIGRYTKTFPILEGTSTVAVAYSPQPTQLHLSSASSGLICLPKRCQGAFLPSCAVDMSRQPPSSSPPCVTLSRILSTVTVTESFTTTQLTSGVNSGIPYYTTTTFATTTVVQSVYPSYSTVIVSSNGTSIIPSSSATQSPVTSAIISSSSPSSVSSGYSSTMVSSVAATVPT